MGGLCFHLEGGWVWRGGNLLPRGSTVRVVVVKWVCMGGSSAKGTD